MPYKLFAWSFAILSFAAVANAKPRKPQPKKPQPAPVVSVAIGDKAQTVTRAIGKSLTLRISKAHSESCGSFGWNVEVVRKDGTRKSANLIYQNKSGHGPDPSQVYAQHLTEGRFLRRRELPVHGFPYIVTLDLSDVSVAGQGAAACFERATLAVSWQGKDS